jgi:hypothetical protein
MWDFFFFLCEIYQKKKNLFFWEKNIFQIFHFKKLGTKQILVMDLHKLLAGSWLQLSSSYTGALCQGPDREPSSRFQVNGNWTKLRTSQQTRYSILITLV